MFREGRLCNVFTSEMYITPCGKNLLEPTSGKLNSSQSQEDTKVSMEDPEFFLFDKFPSAQHGFMTAACTQKQLV